MEEKKVSETALPERPMECSGECRRPIQVLYTEIIGKTISRMAMCEECPVLHQKLRGSGATSEAMGKIQTSLVCGGCGMALDEVKMGASLGCPLCYDVFKEEVIHEMVQLEQLPPKTAFQKKGEPLHIGRSPGHQQQIDPSLKLLALQQALHETLGREDYEQAALLRDQIRKIEEQSQGPKEKKNGGKPR